VQGLDGGFVHLSVLVPTSQAEPSIAKSQPISLCKRGPFLSEASHLINGIEAGCV
jgi:hypothetical protein